MKKVYEKPQVYMERFELSQNIALCDWKLGSGDPTSCRIENDRFEADGGDFTGGFATEGLCDFPTIIILLFRWVRHASIHFCILMSTI